MKLVQKVVISSMFTLTGFSALGVLRFNGGKSLLFADNTPDYFCHGNCRVETTTDEEGNQVYTITHIGNDATDIVIPAEIDDIPVTVTADAFEDVKDNEGVAIVIDTAVQIEEGALSGFEHEIDIEFTNSDGSTSLDYGKILEGTTIGTLVIPAEITSISEDTFYGVTDTTTLIYEGSFDNFYNEIFPVLWAATLNTIKSEDYTSASIPTHVVVDGVTYTTDSKYLSLNSRGTGYVYYFATLPSSTIRREKDMQSKCSFGVSTTSTSSTGTKYYNNVN